MGFIRIAWRASKLIPCPVCGGDHSCSATDEGLHFCWRVKWDTPYYRCVGVSRNGFGMHREAGADPTVGTPQRGKIGPANGMSADGHSDGHVSGQRSPAKTRSPAAPADLSRLLRSHQAHAPERRQLAEILGVHPEAVKRLRVGYMPETEDGPPHWLFAERDGAGRVVGLARRYLTGRKAMVPGSHRGLIYEVEQDVRQGDVILIVEGPSDVLAAVSVGLHAVGRPSNLGGAEHLIPMLGRHAKAGADVVVVGEDDRKDSGLWPGRDGAVDVAGKLAAAWGVPVAWALPPDGVKDLRAWVNGRRPDWRDDATCLAAGAAIAVDLLARREWVGERYNKVSTNGTIGGGPSGASACRERSQAGSESGSLEIEIPRTTYKYKGGMGGEEKPTTIPIRDYHKGVQGLSISDSDLTLATCDALSEAARQILADGVTFCRTPCPRHHTPLLQSRDNPRHGLVIRADCGAWRCDVCVHVRRSEWLTHAMCLFDQAAADGAELHLWQGHAAEYRKTVSSAIKRHARNFLSVAVADPPCSLVLVADGGLPGSSLATAATAAGAVAGALLRLDRTPARPVNTSRPWKMVRFDQPGNYDRRGSAGRGAFRRVVEWLYRRGMPPDVRDLRRGERGDWEFPEGWSEEQHELFFQILADVGRRRGGQ